MTPPPQTPPPARRLELMAIYSLRRKHLKRLQGEVGELVGKEGIEFAAKRLGILHKGTIMLPDESQGVVLQEAMAYARGPDGSRAVDRYVVAHLPQAHGDEADLLQAMAGARYRVLVVEEVVEGLGVWATDVFVQDRLLIADRGMSETAMPGGALAGWVLELPEFAMTTGAAVQVDRDLIEATLGELLRRFRDLKPGQLPAEAAHELAVVMPRLVLAQQAHGTLPRPKRSLHSRKPARNAPCPCGSGKRYKGCCGRR